MRQRVDHGPKSVFNPYVAKMMVKKIIKYKKNGFFCFVRNLDTSGSRFVLRDSRQLVYFFTVLNKDEFIFFVNFSNTI